MAEIKDRILPVGIQSFEEIRKKGYLYVDKTDIIWQLANRGRKYNYLAHAALANPFSWIHYRHILREERNSSRD